MTRLEALTVFLFVLDPYCRGEAKAMLAAALVEKLLQDPGPADIEGARILARGVLVEKALTASPAILDAAAAAIAMGWDALDRADTDARHIRRARGVPR